MHPKAREVAVRRRQEDKGFLEDSNINRGKGGFSGGPVVKNPLAVQGMWVQTLVGELRSCIPCGQLQLRQDVAK